MIVGYVQIIINCPVIAIQKEVENKPSFSINDLIDFHDKIKKVNTISELIGQE